MKNIKYLLILIVMSLFLTGCVKFNASMDIKKDKSMDFSIIYAFDTSLFGEQSILNDDEKVKLENQGFIVSEYNSGSMKGLEIVKKIKNIDEVSSSDDVEYSLSGILGDKENTEGESYIFKVKKGIFKNTYVARFEFSSSDSGLNSNTGIDTDIDADDDADITSDNSTSSDLSNLDYSKLTNNMDLSFNVNLPYPAKSNNATSTEDNNKKLSWGLSYSGEDAIEFEFELYNMTNIYIAIGIAGLVVVIIIILLASKGKKNSSTKNNVQAEKKQVVENVQQPVPEISNVNEVVESVQQPVVNNTLIENAQQPVSEISNVNEVVENVQQPVTNNAPVESVQQPIFKDMLVDDTVKETNNNQNQ